MQEFERTKMLMGEDALIKLSQSTVAVFGIGGVGGYALEALARGGVGHLVLVDNDTVSISNINRQIVATHETIGLAKVDVGAKRALSINPNIKVDVRKEFVTVESVPNLPFEQWDYIIDAIDTVSAKISLIEYANKYNVPIISAMGAGNKLDATAFCVTDIYKTEMDPLAKVLRHELRKKGIKKLKVVYSTEPPQPHKAQGPTPNEGKRSTPGSVSYVPGVSGLILAGEVLKDLTKT